MKLKKLSKRIVSFLTSLLLIVGIVAYLPAMEANAQSYDDTSIPDFDIWKANVWINGYKDSNGEGFGSLYLNNITNPTFYSILAEECLEDGSMNIPATLWAVIGVEEIRSNPNYFYEIMILNYLMSESKFQDFESKLESHMIKAEYTIVKELGGILAEELGKDVDEQLPEIIKNMTVEEATAYFEDFTFTNELLDKVDVAYQSIDKTVDLIEALATMYAVREVDNERIEFIKGLKAYASDNKPFCDAVDELVYIYSSDIAGAWVAETTDYVGELCTWFAVESLSAFIDASPVAPYAALIKGGIFALDTMLSASEQSKQYFSLLAIYTMDCYAKQYLIDLKNTFINNPTEANAKKFNSAFIKYVEFQIYGLNASKEILSIYMVDNLFAYLFQNNYESYHQICDTIDSQIEVKMSYLKIDSAFRKLYIDTYNLEYLDDKENTDVAAESMVFENSEITVPLSYGTTVVKAIFNPVDTTNTNVTATSSDESVASVDFTMCNLISLKLNSVGTTTITAVSEDGGYTAKMTINVVNSVNETVVETPASDFEYTKYSDHVEITEYIGSDSKVVIPYCIESLPVTSIGDEAFAWCDILTSITIPDSVTSIGDSAFAYCDSLTNVTIPDSVTSIGDHSFYDCDSLKSITIPDSVTSIGNYAFAYCESLTSITIPDSVTSIGDDAFYSCDSLTSITIPDSVTSIGDLAFYSCESLTSITIPDSVTSIGNWAFYGCDSLTSITIPDSMTSIGDYVFYYCESLTSVSIGDNVTSIGDSAFERCTNLTSVSIGDSVTSIGDEAFAWCYNLTSITIPDSVTSIGANAFALCDSLTSITIPDSVTSIGASAFSDTPILNNQTTDVKYVDKWVVDCNKDVTSVTIKSGTVGIADCAFYYCDSLTSIIIPDSVTSIGDGAFRYCDSLTTITIPDSVTSIGEDAFYDCYSLTSVSIGDSVTSIGDWAFYDCDSLTSVSIGDSVTSIGNRAFYLCSDLESITIPDSVTSIGAGAFEECRSLTSITIPDSVTSMGDEAFYNCYSLTIKCYSGSYAHTYAVENDIDYELITATHTHSYTSEVTQSATCTTAGTKTYTCSCGASYTETIPATGHSYTTTVVEPTYAAKGYTLHKCKNCSTSYKDNYTAQLVLGTVSGLKLTSNTASSIKMTWNKVNGATGYVVYQAIGGKWQRIKVTSANSLTVSNLKAGTNYRFTVKAYKTVSGKNYYSPSYTGVWMTTLPANVSGFKVSATSNQAVKLTWNKVNGATGYVVYRAIGGKWQRVGVVKTNSFYEGKLASGTNYRYAVRAYKTFNGKNYYSAKYPTLWTSTKPATVSFKVTAGTKKATVSWSKVTGATGYKVYYKTSANGSWKGLKTTTGTSFTKTGLTSGKTYYFTVKAYKTFNGITYNGSYTTKSVKVK